MKKICATLLSAVLLIGVNSNISKLIVNAEELTGTVWNGTADTSWYDAEETEFHIKTPEEFAGFAKEVQSGRSMEGKTIYLDCDIVLNDVSDYANWDTNAPKNNWDYGIAYGYISGTHNKKQIFSGNLKGKGHTITGLYQNGLPDSIITSELTDTYSGLFTEITESGTVSDLNLKNCYFMSSYSSPSNVVGGICGLNQGIIENCTFDGTIDVEQNAYDIGGITGSTGLNAKIQNCKSYGEIKWNCVTETGTKEFNSFNIGGIVGRDTANDEKSHPIIQNCGNYCNIEVRTDVLYNGSYAGDIGGILGCGKSTLYNCVNHGEISCLYTNEELGDCYSCCGGIVGSTSSVISNCYNTGSIFNACGTFLNSGVYTGGIIGTGAITNLSNVYNVGKLTSECNKGYRLGGIAGSYGKNSDKDDDPIIHACYYLVDSAEKGAGNYDTDPENIICKKSANMQSESFVSSLGDAYVYNEGGYPMLAWESNGTISPITGTTTTESTTVTETTTEISHLATTMSTEVTSGTIKSTTDTNTGTTETVTTTTTDSTSAYMKGDVNGDGEIDTNDVFEAMLYVAYKAVGMETNLKAEQIYAVDIEDSGDVDSTDIYYILYYVALHGAGYHYGWDKIISGI